MHTKQIVHPWVRLDGQKLGTDSSAPGGSAPQKESTLLSADGTFPVIVVARQQETPEVVSLELALPDGSELPTWTPARTSTSRSAPPVSVSTRSAATLRTGAGGESLCSSNATGAGDPVTCIRSLNQVIP